jgi:5-methylthioribose kinase
MTTFPLRRALAAQYPEIVLFDIDDPSGLEQYLLDRRLVTRDECPLRVTRAGAGNMNLTLRVATRRRTMIVKQGRPWERHPDIAAPWHRTVVEGRFYQTVAGQASVAARLPELLHFDQANRVLVLEDLGAERDCTALYTTGRIDAAHVAALLDWLDRLSNVRVAGLGPAVFANRSTRDLNHEHIFRLPLAEKNGLDLDTHTPGLTRVARKVQLDVSYGEAVRDLGLRYLADGPHLVHGDFFPGSWIECGGDDSGPGIRIIDPELCFLGAREFDYGVMLAHLALGRCDCRLGDAVLDAAAAAGLDDRLVAGFAGVEIMRRLIGVAQLPLPYGLEVKGQLLALSAHLVLARERSSELW